MVASPAGGHDLGGEKRMQRGCAEVPFTLDSWQNENVLPVNQEECCWQEALRPAQEDFKWKYESKRETSKC